MTKKNSIKKNYLFNLFYQILTMIVPLITTPYLSRVLGAENIGIYSYTLSIASYFILFGAMGTAMYGQREIAYLQDDRYKRSKTFFEIIILRFITMGISLLIFYVTFATHGQYSMYYKILLLEIIANCFDISWFLQGLEEFKKTVIRNSIVKLISVICIFLFVKTSENLVQYFFIYVLSTLLGNVSLWIYLPKFLENVKFNELNIFRHLKPTTLLFIPQIAAQIYTVLDKTMIGIIISDKSEVGFYEQAQKITKILIMITTSLGTVMVPRISNAFAKGENERIKEYMNKSFKFVMLLAFPLMLGTISISKKFVPIFFGEGYQNVVYIINVIIPIVLAIGLSTILGTQYLLPTKKQKEFTTSIICGALVNLCFNFIFIKLWQSIGATIATVLAEFTVTGVQFYIVRREFPINNVIKYGKNYILSSAIMFIISLCIGAIIKNVYISLITQIIISMISYFGILLLMRDELIIEMVDSLKSKIKISPIIK